MIKVNSRLKPIFAIVLLLVAFLFSGCETDSPEAPAPLTAAVQADKKGVGPKRPVSAYHNKTLAKIRQATAQYHDVATAMAHGYAQSGECVYSPMGGMGYHYVNFMLVNDVVDPSKPEALLYEPQKNGKLKLIGVEFIVDAVAWDATHAGSPMLGDQVFDDHRAPGSPGPPLPHYQLHAWVWKNNPTGMHQPFNPTVSCAYAVE
ncbi:hypothetical protein [Pontibacter beigongshangensis]|uniref:hypothetical protein n=1 Tax=Pontibacter beigongshangensis TaxID=2574733 RepID=UPI00164F16AC|nr:hypothetical protein [Pontibacter beigongshangensis]